MEVQHDLAKWLEGKMTAEELEAFKKSPEFNDYEKIRQYSSKLSIPDFDSEPMLRHITQHKEKAVIPLKKPNWFLRIAAVLVIGLGVFFASVPMLTTTQTAANSEQLVFTLPDHSQVTLNAGSEITYKKWNWKNHRQLQLAGEAFFKVAKGKTFEVNTNLGKVTVMGTQFNVKVRGKRFEVSCFEGKVRVENKNQVTFLTQGMTAFFEDGQPIGSPVLLDSKPLWMRNLIHFKNENLAAVISEIERQYNVAIAVKGVHSNQKFTGNVPSNDLDMALYIVTKAYDISYHKTKNSIQLTEK